MTNPRAVVLYKIQAQGKLENNGTYFGGGKTDEAGLHAQYDYNFTTRKIAGT